MINVVLVSTYELGRQPFGLASPAAWLKEVGASVTCQDLAVRVTGRRHADFCRAPENKGREGIADTGDDSPAARVCSPTLQLRVTGATGALKGMV